MTRILTVIDARPQFIKAAAVSRRIADVSGLSEMLVNTGQHYDSNMSDVFFVELDIPKPAHHFGIGIGIGGGGHGVMVGRMLANSHLAEIYAVTVMIFYAVYLFVVLRVAGVKQTWVWNKQQNLIKPLCVWLGAAAFIIISGMA